MTNKKHLRWLYGELPEMVGRAVITAETATKIREHAVQVLPANESGADVAFRLVLDFVHEHFLYRFFQFFTGSKRNVLVE